jgi:hypothetical protein
MRSSQLVRGAPVAREMDEQLGQQPDRAAAADERQSVLEEVASGFRLTEPQRAERGPDDKVRLVAELRDRLHPDDPGADQPRARLTLAGEHEGHSVRQRGEDLCAPTRARGELGCPRRDPEHRLGVAREERGVRGLGQHDHRLLGVGPAARSAAAARICLASSIGPRRVAICPRRCSIRISRASSPSVPAARSSKPMA